MAATGTGADIVAAAAVHIGKPYSYGAGGPNAFDCSGLTQYVFRQFGVSLPHNANAQLGYGRPVSRAEAAPGDLIIFLSGGHGYHAGIYAGGGYMIDAPGSGRTVGRASVWSRQRRLPPPDLTVFRTAPERLFGIRAPSGGRGSGLVRGKWPCPARRRARSAGRVRGRPGRCGPRRGVWLGRRRRRAFVRRWRRPRASPGRESVCALSGIEPASGGDAESALVPRGSARLPARATPRPCCAPRRAGVDRSPDLGDLTAARPPPCPATRDRTRPPRRRRSHVMCSAHATTRVVPRAHPGVASAGAEQRRRARSMGHYPGSSRRTRVASCTGPRRVPDGAHSRPTIGPDGAWAEPGSPLSVPRERRERAPLSSTALAAF